MPYRGTASIIAQVSVHCEACGADYAYERTLKGYAGHANEYTAMSLASESLAKQTQQIEAGDLKSVAAHKPCPQCSYVQSWMVEPVRRRRGWQWGLGLACASYLAAFPVLLLVRQVEGAECLMAFLFFGMPVIVFFAVRAAVRKLYQPNKGREAPAQANAPGVTFRHP